MNLSNKYTLKQKIAGYTLLIGLLLSFNFFLPVFTYFGEMGIREKTVYGFETDSTISVVTQFYCFVCIALATFTFNRTILRITNIIIWIFLSVKFLAALLFSNPYAVYGPISPRTEIGYILSFLLTVVFLIMSSFWRRKFDSVETNRITTIVLGCITGILVGTPIIWLIYGIWKEGL